MKSHATWMTMLVLTTALMATSCGNKAANGNSVSEGVSTGSGNQTTKPPAKMLIDGKAALRLETFGNEGFWTDVVKMPVGINESKLTLLQALKMGLSINSDAINAETLTLLSDEIKLQGEKSLMLNDPMLMKQIINSNAVVGLVVKDTNGDKQLNIMNKDKMGVSCVLCHAVADRSIYSIPGAGSIGKQIDGPAANNLQLGKLFAMARHTKGFYPMAQLYRGGRSIGRAPSYSGLFMYYSEADYDAYFNNPRNYPVGSFDDTADSFGNPVHNTPLFRQDLAAPFGSAGELETFSQYANMKYTLTMDPTVLVTDAGKVYLKKVMGDAGEKLAKDYLEILEEIGVRKYGITKTNRVGDPGAPDTIVGTGVDQEILKAIEVYVKSLRAPSGVMKDAVAVEKGKMVFSDEKNKCMSCHNVDQTVPVKSEVIPMKVIYPGDSTSLVGKREAPLNHMVNSAGIYDDKMITINATLRGKERGIAVPLLMDLSSKTSFLHDNSVSTMDKLFDSGRGSKAPHPFYINATDRKALVEYLNSLDDNSK
jgi:hypothetical protein